MTVRLNYAIYTHMLIQHNQDIGCGIPDPPLCGEHEGLGTRLTWCMTFTHHTNSYTMDTLTSFFILSNFDLYGFCGTIIYLPMW